MALISFFWFFFIQIAQEAPQIEVYQIDRSNYVEIWARNPHIYPVTIELSAELENLSSDKSIPMTDVLKPKSNRKLVRLDPINGREAWNFDTRFATYKGDVFARHQDDLSINFLIGGGAHTMFHKHIMVIFLISEVLHTLWILQCPRELKFMLPEVGL